MAFDVRAKLAANARSAHFTRLALKSAQGSSTGCGMTGTGRRVIDLRKRHLAR
ncbi:MAG TPA: hypothetical protein VFH02_09410 [Jiangellaceae bacterium]|nr:hypothetical protein [Jiangellaceae bacterium]